MVTKLMNSDQKVIKALVDSGVVFVFLQMVFDAEMPMTMRVKAFEILMLVRKQKSQR